MARRNVNRSSRRRYRRAKNMHVRSGVFPTGHVYGRVNGNRAKQKPVTA